MIEAGAEDIDYLILGGGSAGCVLAARLSEPPSNRVVLVEAGRDIAPGAVPDAIRSRYPGRAYVDPANTWPDLTAVMGKSGAAAGPRRYEQARILGGGSAINAMVANRGAPEDYDEWGAAGAEGWSGEVALRYFRKLERDCDFGGPFHGKDGPIPIRRVPEDRLSPFCKGVAEALARRGFPPFPDQNADWKDGVFPTSLAVDDNGERPPVSTAYLTREVRARPNLRIHTDSTVKTLLFDGKRVVGAQLVQGGQPLRLPARETIVCLGGIHSAALLLRSGIGPGGELARAGVRVQADRPGVGANLMDHPLTAVSAYLPPAARMQDLGEHQSQRLLRYTSTMADAPRGDMYLAIMGRSAWHEVGQRIGTLLVWVNKPYSRGAVRLRSDGPDAEPEVSFRLLSDERDLMRLAEGFRLAAGTLSGSDLDALRGPVFPTSYSERVRRLLLPGRWNALQLATLGRMLDHAGPLRPPLLHSVVTLGVRLRDVLADESRLRRYIAGTVSGIWHASGTCRMGSAYDTMAVCDGHGRVIGVDGLRVADSSVMPTIPRANTHLPTLMLAERIADLIRGRDEASGL